MSIFKCLSYASVRQFLYILVLWHGKEWLNNQPVFHALKNGLKMACMMFKEMTFADSL